MFRLPYSVTTNRYIFVDVKVIHAHNFLKLLQLPSPLLKIFISDKLHNDVFLWLNLEHF